MGIITDMMDLMMLFLKTLMILFVINVIATEITNAVEIVRERKENATVAGELFGGNEKNQ